jgi:ADP-heptose:LPS heptosyltransferase
MNIPLNEIQRIAIVRRNGLGDLLCGMPLVHLCKERFPRAEVVLFIDTRGAPLAPYLREVDRVVIIPETTNKYLGIGKVLWSLRREQFDLAISTKPMPMKLMNFFLYGLRAQYRVATVDAAWHSRWINLPVPFKRGCEKHQAVKCLNLLDPALDTVPEKWHPSLQIGPIDLKLPSPTLFVSVTNNRIGSTLDLEKYSRVLEGLPWSVVINCEPKDQEKAERLGRQLRSSYRVVPTQNFADFMTLLASVDAAFVGDGGVMHLAAALDRPQLVLFGGTKMSEWAPLSSRAVCLADPENVNFIPEEKIYDELRKLSQSLRR